jgi:hypothetical protein
MIRTAFLVGASVVAAVCVACAPKTPPPPAGPPPQHRAQLCTDEASFINSVHILKPGYDPADPATKFADPPVTDDPLPDVVKDDLRSAFRIAPEYFRQDVCALDGVFITQAACDNADSRHLCFDSSWGFRSPYDPNKGKRYIAISLSNWTAGHSLHKADSRYGARKTDFRHAQRLTEYSTSQLNTLLKKLNNLTWKAPPKFDSKFGGDDAANASGMTVLAVLAHELGHVRWYDWVEPVPGTPGTNHAYYYDFSLLMKCVQDGFFQGSWRPDVAPPNDPFVAPEWLPFGQPADPGLVQHATGPQIIEFQRPGQQAPERSQPKVDMYPPPRGGNQQIVALAASLNDLYGDNRPWASLLGSLSPTEDLVETYVLSVLTQTSTPLRSLRLNISSPDGRVFKQDVVADLPNKPALARKLACVSTLNEKNR